MPKREERSESLSFRLKPRYLTKLETRATRDGISLPQEAKRTLEATLDDRDEELMLMRVELSELRAEVEELRAGIKDPLAALIFGISKLTGEHLTIEQARSLIENAFSRPGRGAANAHYQ